MLIAGRSISYVARWACALFLTATVALVIIGEDEEGASAAAATDVAAHASVPAVSLDHARDEVTGLLASIGLLEYSGVLEHYEMPTVAAVAVQDPSLGPPNVKPFHWRMIVAEAKKSVETAAGAGAGAGGGAGGANGNVGGALTAAEGGGDDPVPELVVVLKDAPEDEMPLEMPKTRTIGECRVSRSFVPSTGVETAPPIFWSFPGSGNTWIRFLIEQATGYYTGSVYRDLDIIKVMPGELRCDSTVVAVKGHPNWTPFDLVDGAYRPDGRWTIPNVKNGARDVENLDLWFGKTDINPRPVIKGFYKKCGGLPIDRALVVTRDPFSALWAEYQRQKAEKIVNGTKDYGHVAKLAKVDFVPADMRYTLISLMQDWVLQFVGYEGFVERHGCGSVLFQPFEEMVNPKTRDLALARISAHLRRPLATTPACAYTLADHPAIRRDKVKDPAYMTIADAYGHPGVGDLVCDMYEIAGPELKLFGYKPPRYGPSGGVCAPPKRSTPVISKHTILTGGTLNCKSDRVGGLSAPGYYLTHDQYENATDPKPVKTHEFLSKRKAKPGDKPEYRETVFEGVDFERPYLTLACAVRNDNHSGNILQRTKNQIVNLAAYAERLEIFLEVIVVEWNPEDDREPLANVLQLPNNTDAKFLSLRIITVPKELHEIAVEPPINLPVQQYFGKNVAVRRARGEFVLCWNADMMLNEAFFRRVKLRNLRKGIYYRIDRLDFDKPFPPDFDLGNLEAERERAWLELHIYQVRTAVGTRTINTVAEKATFWSDFYNHNDTTHRFADRCCKMGCERSFKSCRWMNWDGWSGDRIRAEVPKLLQRGELGAIEDLLNNPQQFHANAPGDFLMMSREDWHRIRGYPEAPYQDELDKVRRCDVFIYHTKQTKRQKNKQLH